MQDLGDEIKKVKNDTEAFQKLWDSKIQPILKLIKDFIGTAVKDYDTWFDAFKIVSSATESNEKIKLYTKMRNIDSKTFKERAKIFYKDYIEARKSGLIDTSRSKVMYFVDFLEAMLKDIKIDQKRFFDSKIKLELFNAKKFIENNVELSKCAECDNKFNYNELQVDHIKAWSKGGRTVRDNAQLLCSQCNKIKSNK
ncbi:HNH endonuclease [Mycoplasma sp. 4044]